MAAWFSNASNVDSTGFTAADVEGVADAGGTGGGVGVVIVAGGECLTVRGSAMAVVTTLSDSDTKANQMVFQFVFSNLSRI